MDKVNQLDDVTRKNYIQEIVTMIKEIRDEMKVDEPVLTEEEINFIQNAIADYEENKKRERELELAEEFLFEHTSKKMRAGKKRRQTKKRETKRCQTKKRI